MMTTIISSAIVNPRWCFMFVSLYPMASLMASAAGVLRRALDSPGRVADPVVQDVQLLDLHRFAEVDRNQDRSGIGWAGRSADHRARRCRIHDAFHPRRDDFG